MLVLTRKKNESVHIGDTIVVTVLGVRGDKAQLGVEAPATVPVHRAEVYQRILREVEAARSAAS